MHLCTVCANLPEYDDCYRRTTRHDVRNTYASMYYGHSLVDTASSAILVLRIMCSGCSGIVGTTVSFMITRSSI